MGKNKKDKANTRGAIICFRQQQNDVLDISAAAGRLLYGIEIDNSLIIFFLAKTPIL